MKHRSFQCLLLSVLITLFMVSNSFTAEGDTTACLLKNNMPAAWTFTSDDGYLDSIIQYSKWFKEYGLKGTVGLVPDWTEGGSGYIRDPVNVGERHGTWDAWIALLQEGYIDFGNHTDTHVRLTDMNDTELEMEINGAKEAIEAGLNTGYKISTFIYPFFAKGTREETKIAEEHIAARGGNSNWWEDNNAQSGYNTLSPPNFYDLRSQVALYSAEQPDTYNTSLAEMNVWVDSAVANGRWLIETWHGIEGVGWDPPSASDCQQHLQYVASQSTTNIWVGTFPEVAKYIKERMELTIQLLGSTTSQISLSLSDSLDNSIYDFPLTLKTEVYGTWTSVKVAQANNVQKVIPVNESGTDYVYYDAMPDGTVTLTPLLAGEPIVLLSTSTLSNITADGTSTAIIESRVSDRDDSIVASAANSITFSVSGNGTLIGSNPSSAVSGLATIILKSTTYAGTATVNAESQGLVAGSADVGIVPGPPSKLICSGSSGSLIANGTNTMLISTGISDQYNNTVTSSTDTVTFNVSGAGSLLGTTETIADSGVATVILASSLTKGDCTVSATSTGLDIETVGIYTTGTASVLSMISTIGPSNLSADGTSTTLLVAYIKDDSDKTVCDVNNSVTFEILAGPGQVLTDTGDGVRAAANGYATIKLRSTTDPGEIAVGVSGEGFTRNVMYIKSEGEDTLQINDVMNYPNPFSDNTTISFDLKFDASNVKIGIYSLSGRMIRFKDMGPLLIGPQSWPWNGLDSAGTGIANGVHIYKITAVDSGGTKVSATGIMVRMK